MVLRLKDFIRQIRQCKTAADERAVIAKESALIRTSFKEDSSLEIRHMNIAKMLYIHMLGYPTHYGQIECLKLVAGGKYADKRLGYLGIMLLLDENQEVLTLVTNSLKNDMNSSNMYTVGIALCTMGNIASSEMARDLAPEVDKLLNSNNSYVKKKACLAAVKILKKVPDLVDQFVQKAKNILNERNHAVLLTGVSLITEICLASPEYLREFKSIIPQLNRHLKSLITAGNSPEHDVGGVNDPFLQVKILRLLRVLGKGDRASSDAMNDVLAQIATNTDGSKNVGNSILYETCLTIMDIEADSGLRVLAINILGRFLANQDNNIRYVALNTLTKSIAVDVNAVQRHRNTVLECLQDSDVSIKRRALELCFYLINENNIRVMIRELLLFLETADQEFKVSIPGRICLAADQYAPNKRWHIDTVIRVLKLAGNLVKEEVLSNFIKIVASAPELHSYAVYKLYYSVKQDLSQEALVLAATWCIGEYGEVLLRNKPQSLAADEEEPNAQTEPVQDVTDKDVLDLLDKILDSPYNSIVRTEYVLTAALKLSTRLNASDNIERIKGFFRKFASDIDIEVQQRSVEYYTILNDIALQAYRAGILERVPVPPPVVPAKLTSTQPTPTSPAHQQQQPKKSGSGVLDDLLGLDAHMTSPAATNTDILSQLGGLSVSTNAATSKPASGMDLLADVFGSQAPASSGPKSKNDILGLFGSSAPVAASPKPANHVLDLLGNSPPKPSASPAASLSPALSQPSPQQRPLQQQGPQSVVAYTKQNLTIHFSALLAPVNPAASQHATAQVLIHFQNTSMTSPLQNIQFQVAVPKTLQLTLFPPEGSLERVQPGQRVEQKALIINPVGKSAEGAGVPFKLRLKIGFVGEQGPVDEIVEFNGFPQWTWQ